MALPVCQFVDRVGTGAQQRLNLNDGKNFSLLQGPDVRPGPDFSPPKLKRAVVNTLLVDGASIPASAYDNRIIRLPLRVKACDEDEMAEILETLHRELDRGQNVLKWHPTYNFRPVYFRTFRSPDYRLDQTMEGRAELKVTLSLVAEPFGYGDRVDSATITVNNDPAAVANPMYFDITGVEGDIPTPALVVAEPPSFSERTSLFSIRRHGTPGGVYFRQAEAVTQGVDTTTQPNDAAMSGAGNNFSRTTFAAAAMQMRLSLQNPTPFPAGGAFSSSLEYRGTYRVFVRLRKQTAADIMAIRLRFGSAGPTTASVSVPTVAITTVGFMLDLGLLSLPWGTDPQFDGYTNILKLAQSYRLDIEAERTVGAGYLDWDYVLFVPADEELCLVDWISGLSADIEWVLDGPNDIAFIQTTSDEIISVTSGALAAIPRLVGAIPLLTPNQTNRIALIRDAVANLNFDDVTASVNLVVSHWPRYLYVR